MALDDLSFKLHTNDTLTTAFGGLYQLVHETDLSDNPQDRLLYFGSPNNNTTLQATSNPGVDSILITPTYILGDWDPETAYALGYILTPTTPNGFKYRVTTAGTSSVSEPAWPTTIGNTVIDGTIVWECMAATHPITEIKLATTSAGLDSATGGVALNLGTSISGGVANHVEIHIRFTNTNTVVNDNTGFPELALFINEVREIQV